MAEYHLEMRGIRKTFGSLVANDEIDLCVHRGTIHAVIGENGAGKSTLMSILAGTQEADGGEIFLDGRSVSIRRPTDAAACGIGMVYQEFMQFPGLSVLDNLILGSEPRRGPFIDWAAARRKLEDICRRYALRIPFDVNVDQLPVAALQQVEIVKVLYRDADLLILDEPTSVLTPQGIEGLFSALRTLRDQGKTIILITHKLKEVLEISDEITVLKEGRVMGTLPANTATETSLARMMVGREVVMQVEKPPCHPGEELLRVAHLCIRDEKGVDRVRDASFCVRGGEIVGVCGIAGSGESELVSAVVGLREANREAEILLRGKEISRDSVASRRKNGMGYIPQDRNRMGVNRKGAVWETAFMGHHIVSGAADQRILDRSAAADFTKKVLEEFFVKAQSIFDPVSSLSGGNVQKLLLGREFSENYKLMIIEDPTRGIDIGAVEFIWKRIIHYAAAGAGILLVSHDLNEIMQLSDRILVMCQGTLREIEDGPLLSEKEIGLYMLGGAPNEAL